MAMVGVEAMVDVEAMVGVEAMAGRRMAASRETDLESPTMARRQAGASPIRGAS